ncbi:hypothetical protein [Bdellovibrio sp. HCB337]|uniref:hypothetical protein n=1 Tax=Bdellovibrio sp. HCB337 TaxID=3394358 RepID=UPI0039A6EDFD
MKNYLATLPLVLSLVACSSKNSDSPKDQGTTLPSTVGFQKPALGPQLTADQIAEIKDTFRGKPMMTLPPGDLVFPDKNADPADTRRKEQALAAQDPNAYALMLDVRQNCAKGHPSLKIDATFPTENTNNENAFDILQKGDHLSFKGSGALVGNSNCPLDLGGGMSAEAEVKDIDREARAGTASAGLGGKLKFVMKDPKYASLLNARGIIVDTNLSGLVVHREVEGSSKDKALITYNLSGSYLSLKKDIPYNISFKVLADNSDSENQKGEMTFTATLKYPKFTATLVGYGIQSNGQTTSMELYLNGRAISPEEIQTIFGDRVPGQEPHNKISEALLN